MTDTSNFVIDKILNFTMPINEGVILRIVKDAWEDVHNGSSTRASVSGSLGNNPDASQVLADGDPKIIEFLGERLKELLDSEPETKHDTENWMVIVGPFYYISWIPFKDCPSCVVITHGKYHCYLARF